MASTGSSVEPVLSKMFDLPPDRGESNDTASVLAQLSDSLDLVVNQQVTVTVKPAWFTI